MEAVELSFGYGGPPVVENVSFQVQAGDFVGVVGPNGGGKTTLLRLLLGRLRPQQGEARLFDRPVRSFREWHRVGYVAQGVANFDERFPATVKEVVSTGRYGRAGMFRRLRPADHASVCRAMELVGVAAYRGELIGRLSAGLRQRAFIARALASCPEVLILDEPTVAMDAPAQKALYELLRLLNREMKLTLVLVSHDIGAVTTLVSHVACINRRLMYYGSPTSLLDEDVLSKLYPVPVRLLDHRH